MQASDSGSFQARVDGRGPDRRTSPRAAGVGCARGASHPKYPRKRTVPNSGPPFGPPLPKARRLACAWREGFVFPERAGARLSVSRPSRTRAESMDSLGAGPYRVAQVPPHVHHDVSPARALIGSRCRASRATLTRTRRPATMGACSGTRSARPPTAWTPFPERRRGLTREHPATPWPEGSRRLPSLSRPHGVPRQYLGTMAPTQLFFRSGDMGTQFRSQRTAPSRLS